MPTASPVPRTHALRLLLTAWLIDDAPLSPCLRAWLTDKLTDRAWVPTPEDCDRLAPAFLRWAAQYKGLPETITLALQGVTP